MVPVRKVLEDCLSVFLSLGWHDTTYRVTRYGQTFAVISWLKHELPIEPVIIDDSDGRLVRYNKTPWKQSGRSKIRPGFIEYVCTVVFSDYTTEDDMELTISVIMYDEFVTRSTWRKVYKTKASPLVWLLGCGYNSEPLDRPRDR